MKSWRKQFYDDFVFEILENVYEPADDSFLVADCLDQVVKEGDIVLDIGTGCGILAIKATKKAKKVVAIDINPHAVKCAMLNAEKNNCATKIQVRQGDLFQPVKKTEKFNLIMFNAPYLPNSNKQEKTWIEQAWEGGPNGRRAIDRFIKDASRHLRKNGKILLLQSNLAGIEETLKNFQSNLEVKIIAQKKLFFETIVVIQANDLLQKENVC